MGKGMRTCGVSLAAQYMVRISRQACHRIATCPCGAEDAHACYLTAATGGKDAQTCRFVRSVDNVGAKLVVSRRMIQDRAVMGWKAASLGTRTATVTYRPRTLRRPSASDTRGARRGLRRLACQGFELIAAAEV